MAEPSRLQTLMGTIGARVAERRAAQPLQLPFWPENVRGLPNAFARSALFTVGGKSDKRQNFTQHHIASVRGFDILYTGQELRQDDEDVFLEVTHLARMMPLGEFVEFTAHAILIQLGWNRSKRSYDRLRACIDRLSANTVTVIYEGGLQGFGSSLFRKFAWNDLEANGRWRVWLEKEIIVLFGDDTYTRVEWQERLSLPPMAKWLHSFYFSHRNPYGYRVETLKGLCASDLKDLRQFRLRLRRMLELLRGCGFLESWAIRNDIVTVVRRQRRTLLQST